MPSPTTQAEIIAQQGFLNGLIPDQVIAGPGAVPASAYRAKNIWFRDTGQAELWKGVSARVGNIGARIHAVDTVRGSVGGSSLFTSLAKYRGQVYFMLADTASQAVYLNETAQSFTSSATPNKLTVAIPDGLGGYNVFDAGMSAPAAPTATAVAGGSVNMVGLYSVRLREKNSYSKAYGPPSPVDEVTVAAGGRVAVVFPAAGTRCDTWIVEVTRQSSGQRGPWYKLVEVTEADVVAAGARTINYEWRDNDVKLLLSEDNDPPPLATGLIIVNDYVCLWGCDGANNAAPGPGVAFSKQGNPEAFSPLARTSTAFQENIINFLAAEARLYAMTANTLQALNFTGSTDIPFRMNPIWSSGFQSPVAGCIAKNQFFGFSGNGPVRSVTAEDADNAFASKLAKTFKAWNPANVVVAFDPYNTAVVYFHWDGTKTIAYAYMLQRANDVWSGEFQIAGRVMSAAPVNGMLEMSVYDGANYTCQTFDSGTDPVSGYVASIWERGKYVGDKTIDGWQVLGQAKEARLFRSQITDTGDTFPDLTDVAMAEDVVQTLNASEAENPFQRTNYPHTKHFAMRIDLDTAGQHCDEIVVYGYSGGITR